MKNNKILIKQPDVSADELLAIDWKLLVVLGYFKKFCVMENLTCKITSISEKVQGRISRTHEEFRAFDASVGNWTDGDIIKCVDYMQKQVGSLGAYSLTDKQQRVVVYHDVGLGSHFHFQVHP